jgi:hypothetical protein
VIPGGLPSTRRKRDFRFPVSVRRGETAPAIASLPRTPDLAWSARHSPIPAADPDAAKRWDPLTSRCRDRHLRA